MSMRFPLELWNNDEERAAVLTRLAEAPAGPVVVADAIGNVVFLNDAAERLWGERADAMLNRALVSLLGLDARREIADALGRAFDEGRDWSSAVRIPCQGARKRRAASIQFVFRTARRGAPRILAAVVTLQSAAAHRQSR